MNATDFARLEQQILLASQSPELSHIEQTAVRCAPACPYAVVLGSSLRHVPTLVTLSLATIDGGIVMADLLPPDVRKLARVLGYQLRQMEKVLPVTAFREGV